MNNRFGLQRQILTIILAISNRLLYTLYHELNICVHWVPLYEDNRESGENPERSRHCKQVCFPIYHWVRSDLGRGEDAKLQVRRPAQCTA